MTGILPVISVGFRGGFEFFGEDAVKVAFVFIADGYSYFLDGENCVF